MFFPGGATCNCRLCRSSTPLLRCGSTRWIGASGRGRQLDYWQGMLGGVLCGCGNAHGSPPTACGAELPWCASGPRAWVNNLLIFLLQFMKSNFCFKHNLITVMGREGYSLSHLLFRSISPFNKYDLLQINTHYYPSRKNELICSEYSILVTII